jgi:hypothetical protein
MVRMAPGSVWLRHESSVRHDIPGHPERPERIVALERSLVGLLETFDRKWHQAAIW